MAITSTYVVGFYISSSRIFFWRTLSLHYFYIVPSFIRSLCICGLDSFISFSIVCFCFFFLLLCICGFVCFCFRFVSFFLRLCICGLDSFISFSFLCFCFFLPSFVFVVSSVLFYSLLVFLSLSSYISIFTVLPFFSFRISFSIYWFSYSSFLSLHPLFFLFLPLCVWLISGILTSTGEGFILWMMVTTCGIPVSNGRAHVHAV